MQALLGKLATAPSFHLARTTTAHTRHYVPHNDSRRMMLNPFVVVSDPITLVWPQQVLTAEEGSLLDNLLGRLTYFGRAESWCQSRQVPSPKDVPQTRPLKPGETYSGKTVTLLCAQSSASLEQLEICTAKMRRQRRNLPPGSQWVTYAVAEGAPKELLPPSGPQLAIYVLRSPRSIAKEQTLRLSDRIRRELLRLHAGAYSPIFGGKVSGAVRSDDHRHLHVLPEGEGESIEQVLLWAPGGFGPGEIAILRQFSSVPTRGRQEEVRLLRGVLIDQPGDDTFGRAHSWRSVTPYLPARHPKSNDRDSVTEQILRECRLRGLPEPQVTTAPAPPAYVLRRHGKDNPVGPPQMAELDFPEPISGPLLLGANSHFGMGRFQPKGNS